MGDPKGRRGFPAEMHGLRTPDHGGQEAGGKEYEGRQKPGELSVGKDPARAGSFLLR